MKKVKRMVLLCATLVSIVGTTLTAYAGSDSVSTKFSVGSVTATVELGYSGNYSYVGISTSDYADATVELTTKYYQNGKYITDTVKSGMSENISCRISKHYCGDVIGNRCEIYLSTDDGSKYYTVKNNMN
jgi:hypothetical protein